MSEGVTVVALVVKALGGRDPASFASVSWPSTEGSLRAFDVAVVGADAWQAWAASPEGLPPLVLWWTSGDGAYRLRHELARSLGVRACGPDALPESYARVLREHVRRPAPKTCAHCGAPAAPESKFCRYCGQPI